MKFSRLFLISLFAVSALVLVQLPGSTLGWTGNLIVATTPVSGSFTASASPTKPGEVASYTLTFQVAADLVNGIDEIIITWDEDFKTFPSVISASAVSIRAVGDGGGCGSPLDDLASCGVTGPAGNEGQAVAPTEIFFFSGNVNFNMTSSSEFSAFN